MFFDLLRRRAKVVTVDGKKTEGAFGLKNKWVILILLTAIFVLAFGSCGDGEKVEETKTDTERKDFSEYMASLETELEESLSKIKGAGKVDVMLTFDVAEERVPAVNKKGSLESRVEEGETENKSSNEEEVLVMGSGNNSQPYILKERLPVPSGVLVTSVGAGNESVRLELYEAVRALFGISGHRIKIAAAQGK